MRSQFFGTDLISMLGMLICATTSFSLELNTYLAVVTTIILGVSMKAAAFVSLLKATSTFLSGLSRNLTLVANTVKSVSTKVAGTASALQKINGFLLGVEGLLAVQGLQREGNRSRMRTCAGKH